MSFKIRYVTVPVTSAALALIAAASTVSADDKDDPCAIIKGPAKDFCESGNKGTQKPPTVDTPLDPLSTLAKACGDSAAWVVDKLSNAVNATGAVDFTNASFVKSYAIVFGASTFLVLLLWLWAAVKRVVRGASMTTALGEAIGLLWVTVLASAFTPLILYTVVQAVDGITQGLSGGGSHEKIFATFSEALKDGDVGGGPITLIVLSLVSMAAAGVVFLELMVRAALLYVGALLGTVVYAGLVDRDLWGRVRRWAGIMTGIILVKPIIVIVLKLATAMSDGGPHNSTGAIVSGLAIILIAILASSMLFRFIPGAGDDIVAARREAYDPASRASSAVVTKPVTGISAGIQTHAARDSVARPAGPQPGQEQGSAGASSGIAAHASRSARPAPADPPRSDDGRGGRK